MATTCCLKRFPAGKDRHLDGKFVMFPHRVGNSILLWGRKETHFPFHAFVGPEWPCMLTTYAFIIIPSIFFFVNVAALWESPAVLTIGIITFLMVLCAFSATACSEPGIVFVPSTYLPTNHAADKAELGQSARTSMECAICNLERPRTASHCYECGLCVDQLDHHCPWTGKCIARKNLRCFHLFITTLLIHIAYVIAIFAASLVEKFPVFPKDGTNASGP